MLRFVLWEASRAVTPASSQVKPVFDAVELVDDSLNPSALTLREEGDYTAYNITRRVPFREISPQLPALEDAKPCGFLFESADGDERQLKSWTKIQAEIEGLGANACLIVLKEIAFYRRSLAAFTMSGPSRRSGLKSSGAAAIGVRTLTRGQLRKVDIITQL